MKNNSTLFKVALSVVFSFGIVVSISPSLALFHHNPDGVQINISYVPEGSDVITYKLEASREVYLDSSYETGTGPNSGQLTCGDGATTFELVEDGGNYVTSWDDNTQTIYCPGTTTFSWKKYINGTYSSTIGTETFTYEGVYTITPTTDGISSTSIGKTVGLRSIYLSTASFEAWRTASNPNAWFTLYHWGKVGGDTWICGARFNDDNHYRFFVDETATGFKINRMNPAGEGYSWDRVWNDSGNLSFQNNNNCWSVTGWGEGKTCPGAWGTYNV